MAEGASKPLLTEEQVVGWRTERAALVEKANRLTRRLALLDEILADMVKDAPKAAASPLDALLVNLASSLTRDDGLTSNDAIDIAPEEKASPDSPFELPEFPRPFRTVA